MTAPAPRPDSSGPPGIRHLEAPRTTLADLLATLRARWRLIVLLTGGVSVATVPLLLLQKNWYTASVELVAETRGADVGSQLSTLAAIAGLPSLGASSRGPHFYRSLLEERSLRYAVVQREYATEGLGDRYAGRPRATLLEIFRPRGRTDAERLWNAADALGRIAVVTVDNRTNMIRVNVTHTAPALAAAVANAFVEELTRFNLEQRQSQARQRRRFIETRVQEVGGQLEDAENAVRQFLQRNRQYAGSPALLFEYGRLERAVLVQRELYLDLRRQLDAARIAEVDDQPAVTVVQSAIVPQRKSGPRRRGQLIRIALATAVLAAGVIVVREHHGRLFPRLLPTLAAASPALARLLGGGRPAAT